MKRRLIDANDAKRMLRKYGATEDCETLIDSIPTIDVSQVMQWISFTDEPPHGSSLYYMLNFSIKNSKVWGEKNDFIDCAYQTDDGNWYYPSDEPIITGDEELIIKYWMPVPSLPADR